MKIVNILAVLVSLQSSNAPAATFKVKLSQFKVEIPNFKGITVAEDI